MGNPVMVLSTAVAICWKCQITHDYYTIIVTNREVIYSPELPVMLLIAPGTGSSLGYIQRHQ